jgi:arginine decarboxylase
VLKKRTLISLASFWSAPTRRSWAICHNLFGDTNSLELKLLDGGRFEIADLVTGDTIANVLSLAHYDTKKLIQSYEKQLLKAGLTSAEVFSYTNELQRVFSQLTYLSGGLL